MSNPNDDLLDAHIRRRIYLERLSVKQARQLNTHLKAVRDDIIAKLAVMEAEGRSLASRKAQERFLAQVEALYDENYTLLRKNLDKGFKDLAGDQAEFEGVITSKLGYDLRTLTTNQALAAARARPMQGKHLRKWIGAIRPGHQERMTQALRISFTEGESLATARRRVRDMTNLSARGLNAFVRTANTHIANTVSQETYQANDDLVERYEWLAILDSRTTMICASRDGKIYKVGQGPLPPAHVGCRSTTMPVLKDFPPPERVTYDQWLRRQKPKVQDEILGKKRGKAYRKDKLKKIDRFVDRKGKKITPEELRETPRRKPRKRPAAAPPPPPSPTPTRLIAESLAHRPGEKGSRALMNATKFHTYFLAAFSEAPDWAKMAVINSGATRWVASRATGGSYYNSGRNEVAIRNPSKSRVAWHPTNTMRHEYGHAVDWAAGKDPGSIQGKSFYASSEMTREAFEDVQDILDNPRSGRVSPVDLGDEVMEMVREMAHGDQGVMDDITALLGNKNLRMGGDIFKALHRKFGLSRGGHAPFISQSAGEWGQFEDLVGSLTKLRFGGGHTASYYRQFKNTGGGYTTGHMTEAFANWFALTSGPNRKFWTYALNELFPRFAEKSRRLTEERLLKGAWAIDG